MNNFRRLRESESGLAALEFALMLPVVMALYLGSIVVYDFLEHKRDTAHAANTIVDLVARQNNVSNKKLDNMMSIANALSRATPSSIKVRIANIENRNGRNRVVWSRHSNWSNLNNATVATMNVPALAEYDSIIVVQVQSTVSPILEYGNFGNQVLTRTSYRRPLYVEFINKSG